MRAALATVLVLAAGCATAKHAVDWNEQPASLFPEPASHARALAIASRVYGVDFARYQLAFGYVRPGWQCDQDPPKVRTPKGACIAGSLQAGGNVILAWREGLRHSDTDGFCVGLWQAREAITGNGLPQIYTTPPEETAGIAACRAALKEAGQ